MAQPESNPSRNLTVGSATPASGAGPAVVTVRVDPAQLATTLEPFKRELKRIEAQARKAAREVAQLIEAAHRAGSYGIGFEVEVQEDNQE